MVRWVVAGSLFPLRVACYRGPSIGQGSLPPNWPWERTLMLGRTRIALAAVVAALSLALAAAPASAGTLDQQFVPDATDSGFALGSTWWQA